MTQKLNNNLIEILGQSQIYKDYEHAFTETTGLPVCLRPVESWQLPHHGRKNENPMCEMMAHKSRSCASCLQTHQELTEGAEDEAQSIICPLGLCDTAVPIKLGDKLVGFLQTGQVFRKKPTRQSFDRTRKVIEQYGLDIDSAELEKAYFNTRTMSNTEHDSMVTLLSIFAQHLSMISNQLLLLEENAESPLIRKALQYIHNHLSEELSLEEVAKAANMSSFYFCKMFKKEKGINFTDYVSRARIEKAKNLLLNPNLRISEIAYEVGFQSLTHFNRVFKKVVGCSPTNYRAKLPTPQKSSK